MTRELNIFRQKNRQIMDVLEKIRINGLTTSAAQVIYRDNIESIIAHFAQEEREIHPLIQHSVSGDIYLTKTVNYFIAKAEESNKVIHGFVEKHGHNGSGLKWAEEFGVVFAALLQRVRLEDHAIYTIFEERQQDLASPMAQRA